MIASLVALATMLGVLVALDVSWQRAVSTAEAAGLVARHRSVTTVSTSASD